MSEKRKIHSPEFKTKIRLEALKGVKSINQIGQEYGVHPVQVGQWKKAIQEHSKSLFEGKRGPKPVARHQEPEPLYSEIGKLKMELDWLKKKSGISLPSCAAHGLSRLARFPWCVSANWRRWYAPRCTQATSRLRKTRVIYCCVGCLMRNIPNGLSMVRVGWWCISSRRDMRSIVSGYND